MENLILVLLSISTIASVLLLLGFSITQLRDYFVDQEWISSSSKMGKASINARNKRLYDTLKGLGCSEALLKDIARTSRANAIPQSPNWKLSTKLLNGLKPLSFQLEDGYKFIDNYYVDTMGNTLWPSNQTNFCLSECMFEWCSILEKEKRIEPIDFILANKGGNIFLAYNLKERFSIHNEDIGFCIAKTRDDRSKVVKENNKTKPHMTHFEGLKAFIDIANQKHYPRKFNAIFIDDNCSSGISMCNSIKQFNKLIIEEKLPFNKINNAVTLFTIYSSKLEAECKGAGIELHSILSLNANTISQLLKYDVNKLVKDIREFKNHYGCKTSNELDI